MNLDGKTILVTGSTDGVGRYVARTMAAAGAHVLIHGRDRGRGAQLADEIARAGRGKATLYLADFSSLAAVRDLAAEVLRNHPRLDILVNNAGIGTRGGGGGRQTSADGYELRFAVNYLAGFLLTHLLLPRLKSCAPARIVNVSSAGQQALNFSDAMLTREYSGVRAYCQSKLAQILFTVDLARELGGSGITVTALHPATYMDTTMVRQAGVSPLSTVEEGGEAILALAVGQAAEGKTGEYFNGLRPAKANNQAYDRSEQAQLRALSLALTGLAEAKGTRAAH
jgi:NAD(P)-dependent dehydrogenase (short-subunit alcohol dehydrogenase family)